VSGESSIVDVVGSGAGPGEEILPRTDESEFEIGRGRARTGVHSSRRHERSRATNERPVCGEERSTDAPAFTGHRPAPCPSRPDGGWLGCRAAGCAARSG